MRGRGKALGSRLAPVAKHTCYNNGKHATGTTDAVERGSSREQYRMGNKRNHGVTLLSHMQPNPGQVMQPAMVFLPVDS